MSAVQKQRKRIDHLVVSTGKHPNVLDVTGLVFEDLMDEILEDRRYVRYALAADFGDTDIRETLRRTGFELFGVRYVVGRI